MAPSQSPQRQYQQQPMGLQSAYGLENDHERKAGAGTRDKIIVLLGPPGSGKGTT